jgi:hypothetical protein
MCVVRANNPLSDVIDVALFRQLGLLGPANPLLIHAKLPTGHTGVRSTVGAWTAEPASGERIDDGEDGGLPEGPKKQDPATSGSDLSPFCALTRYRRCRHFDDS